MPIRIETKKNVLFNANTYLIKGVFNEKECYLIDVGNATDVLNSLSSKQCVKGIFLTHAHYDHICGINQIVDRFPNCTVFCSEYTKVALADSKVNLSFYHQTPIVYKGDNVAIITDNEKIPMFQNIDLEVIETPGHNEGSLSFKIKSFFFTGDSLIPGIAVVTKLRSGNKVQALESILKIKNRITFDNVIYPGHGESVLAEDVKWAFYL